MLNENSWNKDGLLSKLWFTLMALIVYRLGTYIPIPGVNPDVIEGIVREHSVGVLGIFNLFSGGALGRMTIFALNVMPYIISSIIIQLFSVTIPKLNEMRQDGELGRTKINSYTRYLMIVFCLVQGLVILLGLEKMNTEAMTVVINPGLMFRVVGVGSLLGGTMFLLWLGEKINSKGIGNGISLIIFVGIVSELPGSFSSVFLLGKNGNVPIFIILLMLLAFVLLLILVIFIERSYRKVLVQYPKRQVKNRLHQGNSTYIPLKINISGVIPPIFANALLLSPITIANFHKGSVWSDFILTYFSSGKVLYVIFYALLIVFFAFFYTSFVFDAKETSEMLKKNGGFILGKRPGKSTCDYFEYLVKRLTVIGSMYLSVICILPEVFRYYHAISFTLGGTSFLIMVNVIIDTFSQIQTHIYSSKYSALIKKSDLWKKINEYTYVWPPGSGKGTQSRILGRYLEDISVISMGDLLRIEVDGSTKIGRKIQNNVKNGKLVNDDVVCEVLIGCLKKVKGSFLLDGFPRNLQQAYFLTDFLKKLSCSIDIVIQLELDVEIARKRLMGRVLCKKCNQVLNLSFFTEEKHGKAFCSYCSSTELIRRSDDDVKVIENRIEKYNSEVYGLMEYYKKKIVKINANKLIPEVSQDIKSKIDYLINS